VLSRLDGFGSPKPKASNQSFSSCGASYACLDSSLFCSKLNRRVRLHWFALKQESNVKA